jgi:hypothetical protein
MIDKKKCFDGMRTAQVTHWRGVPADHGHLERDAAMAYWIIAFGLGCLILFSAVLP